MTDTKVQYTFNRDGGEIKQKGRLFSQREEEKAI